MISSISMDSCFRYKTPYLRRKDNVMIPGKVSEELFSILIEISPVRSEKIVNALYEYLVEGVPRKVACERHGASVSYFSISLGRLTYIHQLALQLASVYQKS